MRLTKLCIEKLPGIRPGFALEEIGAGVNLIIGPNACGKTSLCRAVRALLYEEEQSDAFVHLEAEVEDENGSAHVLRIGRDIRWERQGQKIEPRSLPDYRFLRCYTVEIDALMGAGATEEEIGKRIARELSGGYDLQAVTRAEPFHLKSTHAREEARRLKEAVTALNRQRGEHVELQREEAGLAELEREKAAAGKAAHEVEAHRRALSLIDARRERAARQSELADFPEHIARLRGDEEERLERLDELCTQQERDAQEAQRRQREAQVRIEQTGLEKAELDEARLVAPRQRLEELRKLEETIHRLDDDVRDASVEYARAKQELGADQPKDGIDLKPATITKVEKQLGEKRRVDAGIRELKARIAGLPSEDSTAADPERLREGRGALLRWLSALPPQQSRWSVARVAWLVLLILSVSVAVVGVTIAAGPVYSLVVFPIGAALFALLRGGTNDARQQQDAVGSFRRTRLEEPDRWDDAAVEDRLRVLDRQIAEAELLARDLKRKEEARNQLRTLEGERNKNVTELQSTARVVGFSPEQLDASFDRWLHLVSAFDDARKRRDRSHYELEARREQAENICDELQKFLKQFGEGNGEAASDSSALSGRLEHLAKRIRDCDQAERDVKDRAADIERCQRELARLKGEINELYVKADIEPSDVVNLRQRIEQLPRWKMCQDQLMQAEGAVKKADQELGESTHLRKLVEANDKDALERSLEHAEALAASHESLTEEITRLHERIERAQRERKLEESMAAGQNAEEALADRLDEALFARAGQYLLESVESEYVAASRPPVLKQAQKWFRQFTHNHFELEYLGNGAQGFAAMDTRAGERRRLEELSTGTRMQLLLAVRLAFALEAENGHASLPLFLDEALTTADPERYQAVVESIQMLAAEEGRQVFYLTAQPHDIGPWTLNGGPAPHRIDLGTVRGQQSALTDPESIALPPMPAVPRPNGHTAEDYAVAVGVSKIDSWAPIDAAHVFHLLRDDLALLHRLLEQRIERIGTLKALLRSDAAGVLLGSDEIRQLEARVAIAEAFADAWHVGRGRPVGREVIEQSPATKPFYDKLEALAETVNGDARAVLAAVDAKEVKGFRSDKRQELEDWFREHGYLVDRIPLSDSEVELRVLEAVKAFVEKGALEVPMVRKRVCELRSGLMG